MSEPLFMLDSNICVYLLQGASPRLTAKVAEQIEETLCMSSITFAEVAIGYGPRADTDAGLRHLLDAIMVLPFDERAARIYARLPFKRARFDRLIAAHALAANCVLVTNNECDFDDIPGLRVENWTT